MTATFFTAVNRQTGTIYLLDDHKRAVCKFNSSDALKEFGEKLVLAANELELDSITGEQLQLQFPTSVISDYWD